jgi:hypothetical protein
MPRFEELDPNSALYIGPSTGISDTGDDLLDPEDLMPKMPEMPSLPMQGSKVKPYIPTSNIAPNAPTFNTNTIQQTLYAAKNKIGTKDDPFAMAKSSIGNFRDASNQFQFYDRYKNSPHFETLGFSPFRDNETLYNENSSWWDDMKRATMPMARLAAVAFEDAMPGNWGSITDRGAAKKFEEQMAVASSTKGGISGFTTNLYLNSGYTLGIIGEMLVEEAALVAAELGLGAITAGTGGLAAPGTLPAMAATAGLMAARGARGIKKITSAWKTASNLRKTLANLKDANKARKYFNNALRSGKDFMNPLENTTDFLKGLNRMDDMTRLAKTAKGFGAFYADTRQMRLAYGESSLEGGMVQNQMERDLLQQFKEKHDGRAPNKEEAIQIRETAAQAGVSTALFNMPTIYFSNKITFDGLVRGKFKNFGTTIIDQGVDGKILFNARKAAKEAYTKLADGFFSRQWQKIKTPTLMFSGAGKYLKANLAEGLQETAQETIAGWQEDYYTDKFNGDLKRGGYYSYLGDNLLKQVSAQGFETFMSGFLMGGPISVLSKVGGKATNMQGWKDLSMRFKNPEQWAQVQKDRTAKLNETVELLNQFYADPEQYLSEDLINMVEQGDFEKLKTIAQSNGDIQSYYDLKDSAVFKHVVTALKYGRFASHIERLADMKNLSAEEIQESYHMSQDEWNQLLDVSIERAEQVKARWDLASNEFQNPYNTRNHTYMSKEWLETAVKASSWDAALEQLVFNQYSFDRSLERQEGILAQAKEVSGLKNTPYSEFNVLFDFKTAETELDTLRDEVEAFKGAALDPKARKFQKEKEQKLEKLEAFIDAMEEGITNLKKDGKFQPQDFDSIRKSFDSYIDYISKKNGEYTNVNSLNKTFKNILDYHLLKDRSFKANDAVNVLLNPENFKAQFEREEELRRQVYQNRKAEIKKSLEEYVKVMDKNDMLNDLYETNMFFDIEDLAALEEDGKVPDTFYYVTQWKGDSRLEVAKDSEDYQRAIEVLKKYIPIIYNIDIGTEITDPYNQVGRSKLKNDKRTYEDYAKQYGFEVDAPQTDVSLIEVLNTIADSNNKNSTAREKELAKMLATIADKKEKVSFVNNASRPGSYDETSQTVIDARWSSNDYQQGVNGAALEQVILKYEMVRRATEAVKKDVGFKKEMQDLMNEAFDAYDALDKDEQNKLIDPNKRGFEGFYSIEAFVAEAMTNERFQTFLGTVTSRLDNKTQNAWKTFVDKVLRQMRKILGTKPNGTVLNAAMNSITAKLDSMYTSITPQAAKEKPIAEGKAFAKVNNKISISELQSKHPTLANAILNEYIAENQRRDESGRELLDEDYATKSPEEIFDSVEFSAYMKSSQWKKKEDIIREYNKSGSTPSGETPVATFAKEDVSDKEYEDFKNSQKVSRLRIITIAEKVKRREALTEREDDIYNTTDTNPEKDWNGQIRKYIDDSVMPAPAIKERAVKSKLRELGYTSKEIKLMSPGEAWRLSYQGLTKQERNELELADQASAREELAEQRKEIRDRVQTEINDANSPGELMEIKASLLTELSTNPLLRTAAGYTAKEIEDLIQAKLEEMAFNIKFEEIEVGEYLVLNDITQTLVKVIEKGQGANQGFITISHANNPAIEEYINEDEVLDKILYKDSQASRMLEEEVEEEDLSSEDQEVSNGTVDASENIQSNQEDLDNSWNAGQSDSWLDEVNTCDS